MIYALRLSDDELARYRMMADRARAHEHELWELAGLAAGARVADVGCGPGAMVLTLAEIVGPGGHVVGIDGDEQAVKTAQAALATVGAANAEVRTGRADGTGLAEASFDAVVLRHVLSHNGGAEQRIVEHLAELVRPGGHVYLVDVDMLSLSITPSLPAAEDLQNRYLKWHAEQGNDLRVGRRLASLGRSAGLVIDAFRGWFEIVEWPSGMRGPAWAAREAMVRAELATEKDLARWAAAFDEIDSWTERPQFMLGVFGAVCRRPSCAGTSIR
ncbi:MAG TPA: methyltransferase domain-containing protein [Pseudonocardiaceae bacterium]|jgi:ubiquinone/menaquinone biosynthesis C-methylase UbiE|nr:methyltransferase domain-containing protein [Pseudonocardiaceae bacterium]